MNKTLIISFFLLAFQVTGFCQTAFKDSLTTDYIEFGKGGGFSGESKNYLLTQSGDLYIIKNSIADPNSLTYIKAVGKCTTKKIFRYIKSKKIMELTYNEPGNLYQYINPSINHKRNNLVWGNPTAKTPEHLTTLYTKLFNLL